MPMDFTLILCSVFFSTIFSTHGYYIWVWRENIVRKGFKNENIVLIHFGNPMIKIGLETMKNVLNDQRTENFRATRV